MDVLVHATSGKPLPTPPERPANSGVPPLLLVVKALSSLLFLLLVSSLLVLVRLMLLLVTFKLLRLKFKLL